MMRLLPVVFILLTATPAFGAESDSAVLLAHANSAYQHGDYSGAADTFQKIVDGGTTTADMYFNLGTSQLKANRRGAAMLSFERALRLDPSDSDASFNLAEAQKGNIDKIVGTNEEEPLLERLGARIPVESAGLAFILLWIVGNLALGVRWFRGAKSSLIGFLGGTSMIAAIAVAPFYGLGAWERSHSPYAIVVSPSASVREGPAADFKSAFEVHEGLKVRVMREERGFARIRLPNGVEGWVSEKDAPTI